MVWVDSYHLRDYLAEHNIFPIRELNDTAFYIYDERFKEVRLNYEIERAFYRSHRFEN